MQLLLLGLKPVIVDEAKAQLEATGLALHIGSSLEDVRGAFARAKIDHVIIGGGLDLEVRLGLVREIFQLSDAVTVHMKDRASGPQGFVPFIQTMLRGLLPDAQIVMGAVPPGND
jgi:hypothetical protein